MYMYRLENYGFFFLTLKQDFLYTICMQVTLTVGWRLLTLIVLFIKSYER